MARRNLLHKKRLQEFKQWLEDLPSVDVLQPKGTYEVLRWTRLEEYNGPMPIVYHKGEVHLSCNEASIPYVRRFLKETRNG